MKTMILLLLATLSYNSFSETKVEVSPEYSAKSCAQHWLSWVVNRVDHIQIEENSQVVTLSFDTYLFKCSSKEFSPIDISAYNNLVIFKEGINLPWSYEPTSKIEQISPTESHITISFNKAEIFKTNNVRKFSYHFKTQKDGDAYYYWNIKLSYNRNSDTTHFQFIK